MELVVDYCNHFFISQMASKIRYVMMNPPFSKKAIQDVINLGIKPILNFYCLLNPKQLEEKIVALLEFQEMDCLFYVTDLGLAYHLKKLGLEQRVIYDPTTMITNTLDAKEYALKNFLAVGISNEIPLRDAILIAKEVPSFYQLFGYRLMFYSARRLISLYGDKNKIPYSNGFYELKEASRDEHFLVKQDDNGTIVYRGYMIDILKHLDEMNAAFGYLSSVGMKEEDYKNVVEAYLKRDIEKLSKLSLPIQDGFTYQDSVFQKEDF